MNENMTIENGNLPAVAEMGEFNPAPVAAPAAYTPAAVVDDDERWVLDLTTRQVSYCSLKPTTEEERAALYNAQNNTPNRIKDFVGETIQLKHVYVEAVQVTNRETGERNSAPRIVLIDAENNSFQCVSIGVYSAIRKIFGIYGTPEKWEKPLPIKFKLVNKGERSMLTLDIDFKKKK